MLDHIRRRRPNIKSTSGKYILVWSVTSDAMTSAVSPQRMQDADPMLFTF